MTNPSADVLRTLLADIIAVYDRLATAEGDPPPPAPERGSAITEEARADLERAIASARETLWGR